jgi:hypothetical protein
MILSSRPRTTINLRKKDFSFLQMNKNTEEDNATCIFLQCVKGDCLYHDHQEKVKMRVQNLKFFFLSITL